MRTLPATIVAVCCFALSSTDDALAITVTGDSFIVGGTFFQVQTAANNISGIEGTMTAEAIADVVLLIARTQVGWKRSTCPSEEDALVLCNALLIVEDLTPGCKYCGRGFGAEFNASGTEGDTDSWQETCATAPGGGIEEP